jgi:ubiquinone/menaquinone biosynthesis C-methylase UbiE
MLANSTFIIVSFICIMLLVAWIIPRRHNLPCPSWLGWMVEQDNPLSKINKAKNIIKFLDIKRGMIVLDFGCGPGRLSIPLAHEVGETGKVIALDIQTKMLDKVKIKAQKENLKNITFLHAAAGEGALEKNNFDRAVLITVIGEIPNQKKALEEIYASLKPGGILSIAEIIFDPHYQRYDKIFQLTKDVGFKKVNLFSDWFAYNLILKK